MGAEGAAGPREWWGWGRVRELARVLGELTKRRVDEERRKGAEWERLWRSLVSYDELGARQQLFAYLVGLILDYKIYSECVPYYVRELQRDGLLAPEAVARAPVTAIEAALRRYENGTAKKMGSGESVKCRPNAQKRVDRDEWFRKNAEWIKKLGTNFDRVLKEIEKVLEDSKRIDPSGEEKYVLTPSHTYFILRMIDGIGPKKAAMAARDAATYIHGLTLPNILGKVFARKVEMAEHHHTLIFVDYHTRRVLRNLGIIEKGENAIISSQYLAALAYPGNPGAVDLTLWHIGRDYCKRNNPNCGECPLRGMCYRYNSAVPMKGKA